MSACHRTTMVHDVPKKNPKKKSSLRHVIFFFKNEKYVSPVKYLYFIQCRWIHLCLQFAHYRHVDKNVYIVAQVTRVTACPTVRVV